MKIRIYNARILTMEEGRDIFRGEIRTKDNRVDYVGPEKKDGGEKWDREIDAQGNLVMPGFKDAHTHSGMTLLRSYADDLPLLDWLNLQVFPVEEKLGEEDIYHLTKLAVLEYLTSGITGIFDMYLTPLSIARATEECGMRCVQVGTVNNFSQSPQLVEELYLKLNEGNPLTSYIMGFHGEYTCSRELLEQMASLARKYRAPVFTHMAESRSETEGCVERYGMTPAVFLDSLGMFDYGGGAFHCIHMTREDIEVFREKGLSVVTNPGSNTKLASGIAPVSDFLKAGINVAIGTDGPASNNCLDMFREMFLVTGLAKLRENDASAVDAQTVLHMATVGGSKAMGLLEADVLARGKLADLILLDLNQPNMQPLNNISKNIVYSGSKQNVKLTMIDGRILYEDDRFYVGEEPSEIYRKANEIIGRCGKGKES